MQPIDPYAYTGMTEYTLHQIEYRRDFNNDGYPDAWMSAGVWMNQGDNLTFVQTR